MDVESTMLPLGTKMPKFNLLGIDGDMYTSEIFDDKRGSLIMFICNHCPFVKHVNNEIVNSTKVFYWSSLGQLKMLKLDTLKFKIKETIKWFLSVLC